ncbi:S-adenosyl-L-methionine-dependent methyltransferase [Zopfochytrium polystomum]|nr:S-adenosyl-L-methionine-dependent methyltransferase [Zopfochytrium polystomum]
MTSEERQERLFDPPLWIQRRAAVSGLLKEHALHPTAILDLGCGEGALLEILLNDTSFVRLAGLDIARDEVVLAASRCQPSRRDFDYLRGMPMTVSLYCGDLLSLDDRLAGYDAIVLAEVIEHLDPEPFARLPEVVFGSYQPGVVIVTTPNAEFNVHFEQLRYGTSESSFRHPDHRFEMTRKEFRHWCDTVAERFGYAVSHCAGVGFLPPPPRDRRPVSAENENDDGNVGPCTQIALFTLPPRPSPSSNPTSTTTATLAPLQRPHDLIAEITFPFYDSRTSTDAEILAALRAAAARVVEWEVSWRVHASWTSERKRMREPEYRRRMASMWPAARGAQGAESDALRRVEIGRIWNEDWVLRQKAGSLDRVREALASEVGSELFASHKELPDVVDVLFELPFPEPQEEEPPYYRQPESVKSDDEEDEREFAGAPTSNVDV